VGTPLNAQFGARFQHVYRALDCSPNANDLSGSLLDLHRVSWAPYDGDVTQDTYENISVHAAHSEVVPDSGQSSGVPDDPFSGLGKALDPQTPFNACDSSPTQKKDNYIAPLVATVPPGTTYVVSRNSLYTPPGDSHPYHPWPEFTTPFPYDSRESLLLEYRFRPQETPISFENGFLFSPAISSTYLPRYRIYSTGTQDDPLDPDDATDPRQTCGREGENARYLAVFDYVKTTSVIQSAFIGVVDTSAPDYGEPIFDPPLADLPAGTRVKIEFQGADGPAGLNTSAWTENIDDLDLTWLYIRFQLTLTSNQTDLTGPSLDSLVIPYQR
jgi:hypothetical protein